jgi:ribosomal protein S12 methylthiotransferase accessory factor
MMPRRSGWSWGPDLHESEVERWHPALAALPYPQHGRAAVNRGWNLAWEGERLAAARAAGEDLVSVRLLDAEVLVGPRWVAGSTASCAGCAEYRERVTAVHPLAPDLLAARTRPVVRSPFLPELLTAAAAGLRRRPLAPGELLVVGLDGTGRHLVRPSSSCPLCAPARLRPDRPGRTELAGGPQDPDDLSRGLAGRRLLAPGRLRGQLVDQRFGPVRHLQRERSAPFAMSMAFLPDSSALGYGRASTFPRADAVAILEAYERLGAFPHEAPVVPGLSYAEVAGSAVSPFDVGTYVPEQHRAPHSRLRAFDADTPMDWVWGHELGGAEPGRGPARLVPAELGFYRYEYHHRADRHAANAQGAVREHFLHESSSGCALGGNLAEAAMHSLFELTERDAFLLAWYRALPLPRIDPATVTDTVSRLLLRMLDVHGFDVHLLVATQDIDVPVVWALAVNREKPFPATFSAAGSGTDPGSVVRAALWELEQIVSSPVTWDRARVETMLEDPWQVDTLEDHTYLYALPERRERVTRVLGGPPVSLPDAFPAWPDAFRQAAGGDLRGALDFVVDRFARAGLDSITLVDQSTLEHRSLGLAVAKAVVPGITPMCFGYAQQRFDRLPRLAAAVAGGPLRGAPAPYEPHPFP